MIHTLKSSTFKLVALLMLAGTAEAGSFIVGPVSIGDGQTARLHVVNPEGGSVHVVLLFNDGSSHTLVSSNATLSLGETKTLDIHGLDVPGGILLPIVNATMATPPSTCHPVVTLQVFEKGKKVRDGFFAKATILARGLSGSESAAIQALRTLGKAQGLFFKAIRSRNDAPGYASSLGELAEAGLIPADFGVQDSTSSYGWASSSSRRSPRRQDPKRPGIGFFSSTKAG